ncbi:unnamed protein product, partial [Rotaria socialis]
SIQQTIQSKWTQM